ncbi:MAG: zinc-finger domain-containing protein [Chromatiaceae bacterium]|nr:zinc-finger domain-containing protein [Chromatiaceae bacterium]
MIEAAEKTQGTQRVIEISRKDLPLSCPRPQDEVWNMHPRVYLPIEKTREEVCPYCGARYRLAD